MAVVVNRARFPVIGDRRWNLLNVSIGATGQTLTTTLHNIDQPQTGGSSVGGTAIETSIPAAGGGGPITFNYTGGGAQNNVSLIVIGK